MYMYHLLYPCSKGVLLSCILFYILYLSPSVHNIFFSPQFSLPLLVTTIWYFDTSLIWVCLMIWLLAWAKNFLFEDLVYIMYLNYGSFQNSWVEFNLKVSPHLLSLQITVHLITFSPPTQTPLIIWAIFNGCSLNRHTWQFTTQF